MHSIGVLVKDDDGININQTEERREGEDNNKNNNHMNDGTQRIQPVIAKHQLKWKTNNELPALLHFQFHSYNHWMRKVFLFIPTKRYMYTLMLSICTELYTYVELFMVMV